MRYNFKRLRWKSHFQTSEWCSVLAHSFYPSVSLYQISWRATARFPCWCYLLLLFKANFFNFFFFVNVILSRIRRMFFWSITVNWLKKYCLLGWKTTDQHSFNPQKSVCSLTIKGGALLFCVCDFYVDNLSLGFFAIKLSAIIGVLCVTYFSLKTRI